MSTEVLRDGWLFLRPYVERDVEEHTAAVRESLPELLAHLPFAHEGWTARDSAALIQGARKMWDLGADRSFVVIEERTGALLGEVSLSEPDRRMSRVNLGWWTRTGAAGRGVATAAGRLVVAHALGELGFNRVEILVATHNVASARVADKLGAVREGCLRERIHLRGAVHDAWLYALLLRDVAPVIAPPTR